MKESSESITGEVVQSEVALDSELDIMPPTLDIKDQGQDCFSNQTLSCHFL